MSSLLLCLVLAASPFASRVPGMKPMPPAKAVNEWLQTHGQGEAPFTWKLANVTAEIETPGVVWADGVPVKMSVVRVKGTPAAVRDDVLAGFLLQGLFVPEEQPQPPGQLQVTAVDPRFLISYTAIISGVAPVVTVVLAEANVGLAVQRSAPQPALPVLPGAKEPLTTRGETFERVVFEAPGDLATVDAFYADVLARAGFQAQGPGVWQRKDNRINVVAKTTAAGTVAVAVQRSATPTDVEEQP